MTYNALTQTYFITDNKDDVMFEIQRDGTLLRTIDISGLRKPTEIKSDAEGITWMYGERYALVMEGGEEMAVFSMNSQTTSIARSDVAIYDLSGDPKGVAYNAAEDALYWVSQTAPKRVVKVRINEQAGKLDKIWNKVVDNLPDSGLADIAFFPRLSPNAFLIGQSTGGVMEVDLSGDGAVLKSQFLLDQWPIPRPGALAFDPSDGSFRIVGKHAAGVPQDDFSIFTPTATIPNLPPTIHVPGAIDVVDYTGNGALFSVDASGSVDSDGAIIEYKWMANGETVGSGFGPRVQVFTGIATDSGDLTLIVRDDANVASQAIIHINYRRFSGAASDHPLNTFPQPTGYPQLSLNYIHPGSVLQRAEIFFQLNQTGFAEIWIFDQVGRQIRNFKTETFPPGQYRAPWDLTTDNGNKVDSGVYYVLVKTPGAETKDKLVVVR